MLRRNQQRGQGGKSQKKQGSGQRSDTGRRSNIPMLMVACLLMTSGDSGVSFDASSLDKSYKDAADEDVEVEMEELSRRALLLTHQQHQQLPVTPVPAP